LVFFLSFFIQKGQLLIFEPDGVDIELLQMGQEILAEVDGIVGVSAVILYLDFVGGLSFLISQKFLSLLTVKLNLSHFNSKVRLRFRNHQ
jgi:hypothetical protein